MVIEERLRIMCFFQEIAPMNSAEESKRNNQQYFYSIEGHSENLFQHHAPTSATNRSSVEDLAQKKNPGRGVQISVEEDGEKA